MKKRILAVFLTGCMLLTLGACSKSSSSNQSSTSSASSDKPIQMRFSWWGNDDRHQATLQAIQNYSKKHPNVTIKGEYGGWDGYLEKLTTQLAANSAPDIMQIDYAFLDPFWGQIDNFVDFKSQSIVKMDGFSEDMLKGITSPKGKLIGLPTGSNFSIMYANKNLAQQIGIDLSKPYTWDKLLEDGEKVHAYNKDMYLMYPNYLNRYVFEPYLFNLTGKKLVSDTYTLGFDKNSLVKTYNYINQLYKNNVLQPFDETATIKTAYENPRWLNGQVVMFPDFSSGFDSAMSSLPGKVVCINPVCDSGAANTGIVLRPTNMLAVNAKSANKNAALEFVNYFFNDQEAIDTLGLCRSVPATKNALSRMTELGKLDTGLKDVADWDQSHKGGAGQNTISTNTEIETIENDILSKLYYGDISADSAASQFMNRMTDEVSQLKQAAAKNK